MTRIEKVHHRASLSPWIGALCALLMAVTGTPAQQGARSTIPSIESHTGWTFPYPALPPRYEAEILWTEDGRVFPETLADYTGDPLPSVRSRTAMALGRMGGPGALAPLLKLLEDNDGRVRACAAFSIGEMMEPEEEMGRALRRHLHPASESEASTRAVAVEALAKLGLGDAPEDLVRVFDDPDRRVVEAALLSLWRLSPEGMAQRALELSRDSQAQMRWKAAYALMRLSGAPASGRTPIPGAAELPEDVRDQIKQRFIELLSDPAPAARLQAVRGLGGLEGRGLIERVRRLENDEDPRVRSEVARTLGRLEASSDAFTSFLQDSHRPVALEAIRSMASCTDHEEALEIVEPLLRDGRSWVQEAALASCVGLLDDLAQESAVSNSPAEGRKERVLRNAFQNTEWRLRAQAVSLAGGADADGALLARIVGPREEQWMRREDPRVLKLAVGPLLRRTALRTPTLEPGSVLRIKVDHWLGHDDEILRAMAADFLMTFTDELEGPGNGDEDTGTPKLRGADRDAWFNAVYDLAEAGISDPSSDVRSVFVDGLAALTQTPRTLNLLSEALRDPDHVIRNRAVTHLEEQGISPAVTPVRAVGMSQAEIHEALSEARRYRQASIVTSKGTVVLRLHPDEAPLTVLNFARLAQEGYFDDKAWHRVVPDFVVQDGCPRGDGWGGPGYSIRCEISSLRFGAGALGMALSGKDTGGSQYFITHSPQPHLDGGYTVFGRLLDGWDVVQQLVPGDRIVSVRVGGY